MTFAIIGVLLSTFVIGGVFYWVGGISSVMIALLFGAMITPTDPVSVLALFRECRVPDDLKYLVEGESLFNDGTGIVIFTLILGMIVDGRPFEPSTAAGSFLLVTVGGTATGLVLGGIAFLLLRRIEDHLLENALCLVLAYGAFWVAEVMHLSGVIATVVAGLLIGNYGRKFTMHKKAVETVETFFESIDFLINSLLFILIGLELQEIIRQPMGNAVLPIVGAILGLIVARALAVYPLYWLLNLWGTRRPARWSHVLFWGGLRGSIPIALLLGLPTENAQGAPIPLLAEYRPTLLVAGFATVFFSLVVQGMTMKPLLNALGISGQGDAADAEAAAAAH
jgi:CPA1 family monovalent cation:H+ antiporter